MILFIAICFGSALCVSALTTAVMRRLSPALGLIDEPGERKVHAAPVPLGGGAGIWLGVVLPVAAAQAAAWALLSSERTASWLPANIAVHLEGVLYRAGQMWWVLACATALAATGLIDDCRGLPWKPRLLVQLLVALLLAAAGVRATLFVADVFFGVAVTVVWVIVLVNAFNFLDNMDGLSSGVGLIGSLTFAAIMLTGTGEPRWLVAGVLLVLAGSLAGFLFFHNWPPARIFMGDAGGYFIGVMLAAVTLLGTFYEPDLGSRHVILAPLCVLAVPLYDFCSVMIIRLREGRSPFAGDTSHFSHRLVELGLKPTHAVLTIHLATLTTGVAGVLLYRVPGWPEALLLAGLVLCVLSIVAILETAGRRKHRRESRQPGREG